MSVAGRFSPSPLMLPVHKFVDADLNNQIVTSTCPSPSSASPSLHRTAFSDLRQSWANFHGPGQSSLGKGISFPHSSSSCFGLERRWSAKENRADPCTSYCSVGGKRRGQTKVYAERKRPAKLDIPESSKLASLTKAKQFIQNSKEIFDAQNGSVHQYETELYAVASKKGRKDLMEDFSTASTYLSGDIKQAFFGVFDGHGGKYAAEYAANNLDRHVSAVLSNMASSPCIEDAMRTAYTNADIEFLNQHVSSGTCAVSVLVKEGEMVVANAGDCKAVLCRDGKAESLSIIHRASNEKERQRVEDLGGIVDCYNGIWRVQGTLAVTRALGDANLKRWISAEPAIKRIGITDDCEFLILASDGLWDQVSVIMFNVQRISFTTCMHVSLQQRLMYGDKL
ncbi:hypothetical protein KP509_05G022800 [Ceratopteris richardii]|uniref:protein-serine/threonine phosphatase n=1 Tax=Ceratopteris richardii TaxID=49495 RepID=A0A8T2UK15_CERRI|nr:hypothetical protein KP509_05G022800 [Ceratopteris richardii]